MKKQNKLIIGVILGIAVVIILLSFLFPSVYKGLTKGSFGKADKYRQEQMSEADVQLRSEFVQDTAKLRQMITGLIYYALFTENLSMTIDTCLTSFNLQGFDKNPVNTQAIQLLTDYNSFLKNNSPTIANTTRMLAAFLLRDTVAQSMDIEKNLRDFAVYVNKVNEKDSVLTLALTKIDSYLIGNKTLQKKDAEIRNLKAIRDQLVIKSTQFMALTGNKQGLGAMLNFVVSSQAQYSAQGPLSGIQEGRVVQSKISASEISAQVVNSKISAGFSLSSALQSTLSSSQVSAGGHIGSNINSILLYDKPGLCFIVGSSENLKSYCGKENLNGILCGTNPNLGILCAFSGKVLEVTLNAGTLCAVNSSPTLNSTLSATQLNYIVPARELSAIILNGTVFGSNAPLQMGLCGSQALTALFNANTSLIGLYNSNTVFSGFSNLQSHIGSLPESGN